MPGGTKSGLHGIPRAPSQKDTRTRRAIQQLAGSTWEFAGSVFVNPSGQIDIQLQVSAQGILISSAAGLGFLSQVAGTVLAGPVSGPAAAPAFRRLTIGDFGITGVAEELLYINDALAVDQTPNVRYKGWLDIKNAGLPAVTDLADGEFTFSFQEAVP